MVKCSTFIIVEDVSVLGQQGLEIHFKMNCNFQYSYDYNDDNDKGITIRKPNKAILEHEQKRAIEVKCLELQEVLESQG